MILTGKDFQDYEKCARLPILNQMFEPPQLNVREAVKAYFSEGIRLVQLGEENVAERVSVEFLREAAERGYEYSAKAENYTLAQDYGSWLESSLQLAPIFHAPRLPPIEFSGLQIYVDGYDAGRPVLFRAQRDFSREPRWPEMLLSCFYDEVDIHVFKLPAAASGRLLSPLSMAYRHPLTGGLRIAPLGGEKSFNHTWKRVGRWEIQANWQEWYDGIGRDKCLDACYQSYTLESQLDDHAKAQMLQDVLAISKDLNANHPRKRESCRTCEFKGFCHGDAEMKKEFLPPVRRMEETIDSLLR